MFEDDVSLLSSSVGSGTCTDTCARFRVRGDNPFRQVREWVARAEFPRKPRYGYGYGYGCGYQMLESAAESRRQEKRRRKLDQAGCFPTSVTVPHLPKSGEGSTYEVEDTSSDDSGSVHDDPSTPDDFENKDNTAFSHRDRGNNSHRDAQNTRAGHHKDGSASSRPLQDDSSPRVLLMESITESERGCSARRRPSIRMNLSKRGNWEFANRDEIVEWQNQYKRLKLCKKIIAIQKNTVRSLRRNSKLLDIPLRRNYVAYHVSTRGMVMFSIIHEEEIPIQNDPGAGTNKPGELLVGNQGRTLYVC